MSRTHRQRLLALALFATGCATTPAPGPEAPLRIVAKPRAVRGFIHGLRYPSLEIAVTVRARLDNPQRLLRAGMFLTVNLLQRDIQSLVVPEQAIVPEQSSQFVWVVDQAGSAHLREVQTGRRRPGQVEVLSGLEEGERVIIAGTQKAREGSPVNVVEEGP